MPKKKGSEDIKTKILQWINSRLLTWLIQLFSPPVYPVTCCCGFMHISVSQEWALAFQDWGEFAQVCWETWLGFFLIYLYFYTYSFCLIHRSILRTGSLMSLSELPITPLSACVCRIGQVRFCRDSLVKKRRIELWIGRITSCLT